MNSQIHLCVISAPLIPPKRDLCSKAMLLNRDYIKLLYGITILLISIDVIYGREAATSETAVARIDGFSRAKLLRMKFQSLCKAHLSLADCGL